MHCEMGRYQVKAVMEEGGKSTESNHIKHPIDDSDFLSIQRTVKGRVYGRLSTTDRDFRTKRIANKHLYPANYTILYMQMAYINSILYITLLQPLYS